MRCASQYMMTPGGPHRYPGRPIHRVTVSIATTAHMVVGTDMCAVVVVVVVGLWSSRLCLHICGPGGNDLESPVDVVIASVHAWLVL